MRTITTKHRNPQALLKWAERKLAETRESLQYNLGALDRAPSRQRWGLQKAQESILAEQQRLARLVQRYRQECGLV